MIESERKKLFERESEYLNIGITKDGEPIGSISVPWEKTAAAMNMRLPDVYISPEDINDKEIFDKIKSFTVLGCYIRPELDDYSFLSSLPTLWDVNIRCAKKLGNLNFLFDLPECRMLFIYDADLTDIDAVVEKKLKATMPPDLLRCFGLYNCRVEKLPDLSDPKCYFSEFIICNPKERNEREHWMKVTSNTKRYYEID